MERLARNEGEIVVRPNVDQGLWSVLDPESVAMRQRWFEQQHAKFRLRVARIAGISTVIVGTVIVIF